MSAQQAREERDGWGRTGTALIETTNKVHQQHLAAFFPPFKICDNMANHIFSAKKEGQEALALAVIQYEFYIMFQHFLLM